MTITATLCDLCNKKFKNKKVDNLRIQIKPSGGWTYRHHAADVDICDTCETKLINRMKKMWRSK